MLTAIYDLYLSTHNHQVINSWAHTLPHIHCATVLPPVSHIFKQEGKTAVRHNRFPVAELLPGHLYNHLCRSPRGSPIVRYSTGGYPTRKYPMRYPMRGYPMRGSPDVLRESVLREGVLRRMSHRRSGEISIRPRELAFSHRLNMGHDSEQLFCSDRRNTWVEKNKHCSAMLHRHFRATLLLGVHPRLQGCDFESFSLTYKVQLTYYFRVRHLCLSCLRSWSLGSQMLTSRLPT